MRLEDFEGFCAELTLDNGRPMLLEDFQRRMLGDFFAGVRETLILMPKKNSKTTTLAALGLMELISQPDAAIYVAAASRKQAGLLYDFACGFIARSPALREQVVVRDGYKELWAADGRGKLHVLAADHHTADGALPTLALVDELGHHKSGALYGSLADGLGPRDGRVVTISTAGDDEESPLGQLRQRAYALGVERDGAYRHARSEDFAMHEWALDASDDLDDLELVKTANPASWQTVAELRKRKQSPSMTPWRWGRFACGVWMYGEHSAISDREWAGCAEPGLEIPPGARGVIVGLDLAWRGPDTTALTPVWRDGATVVVGTPTVLEAPADETSIDAADIWAAVTDLAARWPTLTIVADPNAGAPELLQKIERELPHVALAEYPQAPHAMAMAAGRLQEAIASGILRHPDDPTLTRHVLAATPVTVGEGYRFRKARRGGRPIDALIALAMAYSVMVAEEQKPKFASAHW
ncbi:MAG: terminase large subunit [Actinomycetota bacterium]|nr:terminase large subunit [Actinomycetota bacterium]